MSQESSVVPAPKGPGTRPQTAPPPPDPIVNPPDAFPRTEPLGLHGLVERARLLARGDTTAVHESLGGAFLARFRENRQRLYRAYEEIAGAARGGESLTPAAEWLLDNFYIIEEQLREIEHDLPRRYYLELPKLRTGPLTGEPRVYALAVELIASVDNALDEETLTRFVQAYQEVSPLTIGETWAVPIMLRVGLVQALRRLADEVLAAARDRAAAATLVDRLQQAHAASPAGGQAALGEQKGQARPAFVAELVARLRDHGPEMAPCVGWLEERMSAQGRSVEEVIRAEHHRQAANQVSVGNAITSMKLLSNLDWPAFFERVSQVEQALRRDPAGVYQQMDFATRDRYRHVVEQQARQARVPELAVANRLVELAGAASAADPRRGHIGYYLVDAGREELEAELGIRPALGERIGRLAAGQPAAIYLTSVLAAFGLVLAGLLALAAAHGAGWAVLLLLGVLAAVPASELAVSLVNFLITTLVPPRVLPKLELRGGIPPDCKTLVVMPAMLFSADGVRTLLERLEIHYLANPDPGLGFALLTDFADAPEPDMPEDGTLLSQAVAGIGALNARYGQDGRGPFYLFHRSRRWNAGQGRWMGWERKRGKLHELNRMLRGASDTTFQVREGDLARLEGTRFVITLDADTQMPHDAARRLVGALAHVLNRPRFDAGRCRVVEGYAILQPRVGITLASAERSWFARMFSDNPGLDPYTTAVSDLYQDLFGEGSYTGKGIYDVDAFEAAVGDAFPENAILSHDLIEGCHARVGLVTDVMLFDEFPSRYHAYARRQHRWIRGDWQLLPWLFHQVPCARGRRRNPLTLLSRWKVFDNLRRSLVFPALWAFLAAAWVLLPAAAWAWTAAAAVVLGFPVLAQVVTAVFRPLAPRRESFGWRDLWLDVRKGLAQAAFTTAVLPHQAYLALDAVLRTLTRLVGTRRNLLEWETSWATEHRLRPTVASFFLDMWVAPAGAVALGAAMTLAALPAALPLLLAWCLSPLLAYLVSRPGRTRELPLTPEEALALCRIARRTWGYFERFVGPDDHWLPPDNYQEQPKEDVAHRTSPTNEGLFLVAALAAHDLGYLGAEDLAGLLERNLDTWQGLPRHRGHFFNWYDTHTLDVLPPRYLSTVDSGNLAACLLTVRQGLAELVDEPLIGRRVAEGMADTARWAREALARVRPLHARQMLPEWAALERIVLSVEKHAGEPAPEPSAWARVLGASEKACAEAPGHLDRLGAGLQAGTEDLAFRFRRLDGLVRACVRDLDTLMPWWKLPPSDDPESSAAGGPADEVGAAHRALRASLAAATTLRRLAGLEEQAGPALRVLADAAPDPKAPVAARAEALRAAAVQGARAAAALLERLGRLAGRLETLATEADFSLLYDPGRRLFSIGFNLDEGRLDRSYYDLLASEARLASFLAIGKGDADQRNWFKMGRPLTRAGRRDVLLSWGGTMFEYLMPLLFTRNYPGTLLHESCRGAVDRQIEYGRLQRVPWGVSESAFAATSAELQYHYQSFGVPGLGLKRGLAKDLVVSPYSTALALAVYPRAALANFRALAREGAEGPWGYYDAIDYTGARLPVGERSAVVRCYMAHHQGMTLVALANALLQNRMPSRFHALPIVRATELLLQERVPAAVPLVRPHGDEVTAVAVVRESSRPVSRRLTTPDTPTPRTHLLSNGSYSVMVTNAGTGYSACGDVWLTRWRPDATCDPWGQFLYVRDLRNDLVWSAGFQPVRRRPEHYEVLFSCDKAVFRRRDGDVETALEIAVSPETNAEIRQLTLVNHGRRARDVEVTSYAEVVLGSYAADLAHPAFQKLFVQTEFVAEHEALLAVRRPRGADAAPAWLVHVISGHARAGLPVEYETDRARFLGRGRTPQTPAALEPGARLSGTAGPVLDPVVSLRRRVRVAPGASARLAFCLAVAKSREEAVAIASRFHDARAALRTLELAWAHSQVELRHLHLSAGDAHLYQRLASALLYPDSARRAAAAVLAANTRSQQGLWPYGISGDYPLVLVRLTDPGQIALAKEVIEAHAYWRGRGLVAELAVLNDQPAGYRDELQEQLNELAQGITARALMGKRGGIFLLRGAQVPEADRTLLQAAASLLLHGDRGALANQAEQAPPAVELPEELRPRHVRRPASADPPLVPPPLRMANGWGGFGADGREYVVVLNDGRWTPAPWVNVIANPHFGCLISESGGGYTWAANSRENKLTPWANDPVADPPGEALYVRDEETGAFWSPTPLPIRGGGTYLVRHGPGCTRFSHRSHGLLHDLTVGVASEDPVKLVRLTVRNESDRLRRLSATYFAEWVLGVNREQTQLHLVTERDGPDGPLLAWNTYSQDFADRTAFLAVAGRPFAVTGDRTEFLGRNGTTAEPAALARETLSGCTGAGLDPGGAVQTRFDLAPGEEAEVVVLLGQAQGRREVRELLARYHTPELARAALAAAETFWDRLLGTVRVRTPDGAADLLFNRWLLYQVLSCRVWGRSALYQSGGAYGFRDQLQDVMALVYAYPEAARGQLLRAGGRQFGAGDVQHWWHPPVGRGIRTRFSDDYLWLPFVACHYVQVTGDAAVLDERLPYLSSPPLEPGQDERYETPEVSAESDTLYAHCLRAIEHGFRFGAHGLPLMGCGDWNDGMNRVGIEGRGESVWVAWFLLAVLERFVPLVEARGDARRAADYREQAARLRRAVEEHAWDGGWYRRAYYDDGTPLGSAQSFECRIDSLPQSWAVLAGGDRERARAGMRAVDEQLVRRDARLVLLFTPPFDRTPHDPGYIKGYLPGVRENGGQYTHAAFWVVQAFARLGEGDRAWEILDVLNPVRHSDQEAAQRTYHVEPYVVAADVYSAAPHTGRGGWTWYTGSAAWMYRVILEDLLGFQLTGDRLRVEPCIPASWPGFELTYRRGDTTFHVRVENPAGVQTGVRESTLDGRPVPDGAVPLAGDGGDHQIRVVMG